MSDRDGLNKVSIVSLGQLRALMPIGWAAVGASDIALQVCISHLISACIFKGDCDIPRGRAIPGGAGGFWSRWENLETRDMLKVYYPASFAGVGGYYWRVGDEEKWQKGNTALAIAQIVPDLMRIDRP